jgi:hypothetical protein
LRHGVAEHLRFRVAAEQIIEAPETRSCQIASPSLPNWLTPPAAAEQKPPKQASLLHCTLSGDLDL